MELDVFQLLIEKKIRVTKGSYQIGPQTYAIPLELFEYMGYVLEVFWLDAPEIIENQEEFVTTFFPTLTIQEALGYPRNQKPRAEIDLFLRLLFKEGLQLAAMYPQVLEEEAASEPLRAVTTPDALAMVVQTKADLTYPEKKWKVPEKNGLISDFVRDQMFCISDGNIFYVYNGQYYEPMRDPKDFQFIKQLYQYCFTDWSARRFKEISINIISDNYVEEFDFPDHLIAFKNGLFNLETKALEPFSPKYHCTAILDFEYSEDQPQGFLQAMEQILPNEADRHLYLSYMQLCLTPSMALQRALICIGEGANGKTKLAEFFLKLFGDRVGMASLEDFHGNESRNAIAELQEKHVLYFSEIGTGQYLPAAHQDTIKDLVTATLLGGRQVYEKKVSFRNKVKLLICTNHLPELQNEHTSFSRRFLIIEFTECFEGENRDETLFERLYEEEAAQVLSYLARYDASFDTLPTKEEVLEDWLNRADSIYAYLKEVEFPEYCIFNQQYRDYQKWCYENHRRAKGAKTFERHLPKRGYFVESEDRQQREIIPMIPREVPQAQLNKTRVWEYIEEHGPVPAQKIAEDLGMEALDLVNTLNDLEQSGSILSEESLEGLTRFKAYGGMAP